MAEGSLLAREAAGSRPGTGVVKLNNVMSERYISKNRYRSAANQEAGKVNRVQGKNTKRQYELLQSAISINIIHFFK